MSAADVIKTKMAERGLRQIDLVPVIGSRGRVSEIVNGKRTVSKAQALKLAKFLRCPLRELIKD